MVISITLFIRTHVLNSQMVMNRSCNFHLFLLWCCFSHLRTKKMIEQVRLRYYLKQKWSQEIWFLLWHLRWLFLEILECPPSTYKGYADSCKLCPANSAHLSLDVLLLIFPLMRFEIAWNTSAPSSVHKLPRVSILFCILRTILRLCETFKIVVKT